MFRRMWGGNARVVTSYVQAYVGRKCTCSDIVCSGVCGEEMHVWCGGGNGDVPIQDNNLYSLNLGMLFSILFSSATFL